MVDAVAATGKTTTAVDFAVPDATAVQARRSPLPGVASSPDFSS